MALKLKIIIGSTRPGRIAPYIAKFVEDFAKENTGFDVETLDLAAFNLPLFDEPMHPIMQNYQNDTTKAWASKVEDGDAFVVLTPEYDGFPPAALSNAIQYLVKEWSYKPAAIVSYGGVSAGMRSSQQLRLLLNTLNVMPIAQNLPIPFVQQFIDGETFTPNDETLAGAKGVFAELEKWAAALAPMHQQLAKAA